MSITIIGEPSPAPYPADHVAPLVYLRETWEAEWELEPELQLLSFGVRASSSHPSSCEVFRPYGKVKMPYELDYESRDQWDLDGWWIKITMVGEDGEEVTQFVGKIDNTSKQMQGTSTKLQPEDPNVPMGRQHWVAAGGLKILQKLFIMQSAFADGDDGEDSKLIGWIPAMNAHDKRGMLVGNRSESPTVEEDGSEGHYRYGGSQIWNHWQYLLYLVREFIQQDTGPTWTISGQIDALTDMETTVRFPEVVTAAEALRLIIPIKYGLDFYVKATQDGFEIVIFSLSEAEITVGGRTMPANPESVWIERSTEHDLVEINVVESSERRYDFVQVLGSRIVVCGSLTGPNSVGGNSLVKKWSDALEQAYLDEDDDTARGRDKYRDVFQHLGAPADWDLDNGAWSVRVNFDGTLITGPFQTSIRETLSWIPLKEGFDYTTDPPTDNTAGGDESAAQCDVKPPMAWVFVEEQPENDLSENWSPRYIAVNKLGIHVHKPFNDWGLVFDANPNHKLAKDHMSDEQAASSAQEPLYDYETAVATIAIESDHRLVASYTIPDELAAGDGSVLTLLENDAELWVMLPGTYVDTDAAGALVTGGSEQRILRDDTDRIRLVLAGAVSKYINDRVRAQLVFKQFQPWADLVGSLLTLVQQGDDQQSVGTPITSIEWNVMPTPSMTLKTGYA